MLSMRSIFQRQSSATDRFWVHFTVGITVFTMTVHIEAWRERQLELLMCDLYMTYAGLRDKYWLFLLYYT